MNIKFPCTYPIIILAGPTAVGKTSLSIEIAETFGCEIISVDSMQVYRYMDIGTAKATQNEMAGIPHYLIDIVNPDEPYDAAAFVIDSSRIIEKIASRGKKILLTGGTGLYYKALLNGISEEIPYFPEIRTQLQKRLVNEGREVLYQELAQGDSISHVRIHINDTHRLLRALEILIGTGVPWSQWIANHQKQQQERFPNSIQICLNRNREALYERIEKRCNIMMKEGFPEEVEQLLAKGYDLNCKSMNSIGYKHMTLMLLGKISQKNMMEDFIRDTRRYAKRQFTWFKKMEQLQWCDVKNKSAIMQIISKTLNHH